MKKINLLLVLGISVLLCNCSDDNEDDNSNSTEIEIVNDDDSSLDQLDITGTWIGTKLLIDEPYDFNNDGIFGTDYKVELPCLIQDITFNSDGTGTFEANIHSIQLDGTLDCVEFRETPITWELNETGTTILILAGDETAEILIVDENTIERFSEALLDEDIGIPGKAVYERE